MIISRDLCLRVESGCGLWMPTFYNYCIDDDVTILKKDNYVIKGVLKEINIDNIIIKVDSEDVIIYFEDIEKIADTDWLHESDIREK